MNATRNLVLRALLELLRYDVIVGLFGFRRIHRDLADLAVEPQTNIKVEEICAAMAFAMSLYWKPVHCLQRSATTVRLLRRNGVGGRLVIGYRLAPFLSHAWVEVQGAIVNDSPAYQRRLHVLDTI